MFVVFDLLLTSLLIVFQVSLRFHSEARILFMKYALLASLFILVALFLNCRYADIKNSDLFLTAAILILSLALKTRLRSEDIQGEYLSETAI